MRKTTAKPTGSPFDALRIAQNRAPEPKPSEQSVVETSKQPDIQTADSLAKSRNPSYVKFTTYISRDTHLRVKSMAVRRQLELSVLVERLLRDWLQAQPGGES